MKAGADIIRTNTLAANAVQLGRHGLSNRVNEINWQAAQLARQAAKGAFVAGSVGPLGISSAEAVQGVDREECFQTQIGALLEGGVDLIFLRDPRCRRVARRLACEAVPPSLPGYLLISARRRRLLPGKVSLEVAFEKLVRHDAEIFGLSCTTGAEVALLLVERLMPAEPAWRSTQMCACRALS